MTTNQQRITDAMEVALGRARGLVEGFALVGYGVASVTGPDGEIKQLVPFHNIVTTAGDQYYAKMGIVGVSPANASAPTLAARMKLGTATTAASKSGSGAYIGTGTYISGSNNAFDTSYPQAAAVGGDGGWNATYQAVWAAGDSTNSAIAEVAIVTSTADAGEADATTTISRAVFSPAINKGANDTLTVTWSHKFLGA